MAEREGFEPSAPNKGSNGLRDFFPRRLTVTMSSLDAMSWLPCVCRNAWSDTFGSLRTRTAFAQPVLSVSGGHGVP